MSNLDKLVSILPASFQVLNRSVDEDAVLLGYEAALLVNRSFETSVTGYHMMERSIPEQNYFQTSRRGIAEDLKFCFLNLVIFIRPLQFNIDAEGQCEPEATIFRHTLPEDSSPITRIDLNFLTCL